MSKTKRKPSTAINLSIISPGLGHIYCGQIAKGLILEFITCMTIPAFLLTFFAASSILRTAGIIGLLAVSVVVYLIAIIDSSYAARHTKHDYELKDYNRWFIYVIIVLMSTAITIPLAFVVKSTIMEAFVIPTTSNYPTINPGDRVIANKLTYQKTDPTPGDLIVFWNPRNRHQRYIKRVIAIAGDTVEVKAGNLYINDKQLPLEGLAQSDLSARQITIDGKALDGKAYKETNRSATYTIFQATSPSPKKDSDFAKLTIPPHHCFVLGDNRAHSEDSRIFGPIPLTTIIARADYLYFPLSRLTSLKPAK